MKKKLAVLMALAAVLLLVSLNGPQPAEAGCWSPFFCTDCVEPAPGVEALCDLFVKSAHCSCDNISGGCIAYGSCFYVSDPPY